MELRTGKSIWDDMPEEWVSETGQDGDNAQGVKKPEKTHVSIPSSDVLVTEDPQEKIVELEEAVKLPENKPVESKPSKRKQKKIDKAKYAEFEKRSRDNKINSSDHAKKAYQREEKENKHDFMILGIVMSVIVIGIIIFVIVFTKTSTQHVYDLINQGNYSIAYQEIGELHDKDKNVDSLVFAFAEQCARNSEYKRAVASLEYLSSEAETNKEFFDNLIDIMLSHGKVNRAYEVLDYMQSHGDILSQYAIELYNKYIESF